MSQSSPEPWTPLKVIDFSVDYLRQRGVDSPRLDVELMLAHVLGWKRIELYSRFGEPLPADKLADFRELLKQRAGRRPVQYLLGKTEFMSMDFEVTPDVLIPRPETEHLVEVTLDHLRTLPDGRPGRVLEIGTGSGAVACAVAKYHDSAEVTATDISTEALAVARRNVDKHGLADRVHPVEADLHRQLVPPDRAGPYDVIVSNPPYIAPAERDELQPEVKDHEPALALFTGDDPLEPTRRILEQAPALLADDGLVAIELGWQARPAVERLAPSLDGLALQRFVKDLAGIDRVVVFTRSA